MQLQTHQFHPHFNPHSRKGSDEVAKTLSKIEGISIHTPARGVTTTGHGEQTERDISIHTPARGVTTTQIIRYIPFGISIHTPARGVTKVPAWLYFVKFISIHTPARGVTDTTKESQIIKLFQSTLPQGE